MTEPDPRALTRADFDAIRPVPTRWSDNDMFGHLNNAVYLELFDSVLNAWMQAETGIDENTAPTLGSGGTDRAVGGVSGSAAAAVLGSRMATAGWVHEAVNRAKSPIIRTARRRAQLCI